MKVKIGKYPSFLGPYQLAEKICFWARTNPKTLDKPDYVHKFGEFLAYGSVEPEPEVGDIVGLEERKPTRLHRLLMWLDGRKQRRIKIQLDPWDSWSADHTLALIIAPVLRQLRDTKHGSPWVDDADVPERLRSTSAPPLSEEERNAGGIDELFHDRWNWVMNEMIWAFEQVTNEERESQFYSDEELSMAFQKMDNGNYRLVDCSQEDPVTYQDRKALQAAYEERIQRGINFFAKYYNSLWD